MKLIITKLSKFYTQNHLHEESKNNKCTYYWYINILACYKMRYIENDAFSERSKEKNPILEIF